MKYKAIIFDLDGTIIDSEEIWHEAGHALLTRRNIQLSQEEKTHLRNLLRGGPLSKSCSIIKDFANLHDPLEDLVKEKISVARMLYQKGVQFMDGFTNFHSKALNQQLKTAIATNGTADFVAITNQTLNLVQFFGNHIYHMSHVNKAKPAPDIYLYAARQLGIDPAACIAIEDSAHGIKAAKDAGMFCIGYNSSKSPELLQQSDLIVNHFDDIQLDTLIGR